MTETDAGLTSNPDDKHPFHKKQQKAVEPTKFTDAEAEAFNRYLLNQRRKPTAVEAMQEAIENYLRTYGKAKSIIKPLKATIPENIVAFLEIHEGSQLIWTPSVENGERIAVVRKRRKANP